MKKKAVSTNSFQLPGPTDFNVPPGNLTDYCTLIFGEKGVGKTSLCAQFPDAIVGMLEPRRRNLKIRQVNLDGQDFDFVENFIKACIKDKSVKTVVLDTADRLYDVCFDSVCEEAGVSHPREIGNDFGASWRAIKDRFEQMLSSIQRAGKGLVLTSHAKWKEIELRNGANEPILCPTLSDAPFTIIKALTDYAFYYGYAEGNRRAMYLRGRSDLWASNGSADHFCDPNGKPNNVILLGREVNGEWLDNPKIAFEQLQKGFRNELWDAERSKPSEGVKKKKKQSSV